MPQLNPAPWLLTFIIVWSTAFALMKLMTALHNPLAPTKHAPLHHINTWAWMWL